MVVDETTGKEVLNELRNIYSELAKLNINMERNSFKTERNTEEISNLKADVKEIKTSHQNCPARIKLQSHTFVIKDIVFLAGFVAAIGALLKAFNIIK